MTIPLWLGYALWIAIGACLTSAGYLAGGPVPALLLLAFWCFATLVAASNRPDDHDW